MDLVVYDDADRRYVPWGVVLSALLLVAAVVGVLTFVLTRDASSAEQISGGSTPLPATAPTASPSQATGASAAPACLDALSRADAALERSTRLEQALAEHTRIMDELLAERLDTQQALEQTLPGLTSGATDRRRFAQELEAYERARQDCSGD